MKVEVRTGNSKIIDSGTVFLRPEIPVHFQYADNHIEVFWDSEATHSDMRSDHDKTIKLRPDIGNFSTSFGMRNGEIVYIDLLIQAVGGRNIMTYTICLAGSQV